LLQVKVDIFPRERLHSGFFINLDKNFTTMAEKTRYSDEELQEFKELILEKLEKAKRDYEVLKAQLDRYNDTLENDIAFLSKFSTQNNTADFAGFIIYNEEGVEVFNFGKNKGVPVVKVLKEQPGYFAWMLNGEFPLYTKKILTEIRLRTAGLVK